MSIKFTITCYPTILDYNNPNHPRHRFPENWDDSDHPRFHFERIQNAIKRLEGKGYTMHFSPSGFIIQDKNGYVVFDISP